uniref:Rhodanase C-terminal domain-containing protein n=1 Tax=Lotharella globosa TaxID=91324 RepID=A0A6V3P6T4_9EUKA|mmetsp:Transcript_23202/g.46547  ORF Transcript_23202/g.46547 Transcript_23202/m.46547 type:complete len:314 (+) Transcript_23202:51-992(+)
MSIFEGGIHKYLEAYPNGGQYEGKLFVFDKRRLVQPPQCDVVGKCEVCGVQYDHYTDKTRCCTCRALALICPDCVQKLTPRGETNADDQTVEKKKSPKPGNLNYVCKLCAPAEETLPAEQPPSDKFEKFLAIFRGPMCAGKSTLFNKLRQSTDERLKGVVFVDHVAIKGMFRHLGDKARRESGKRWAARIADESVKSKEVRGIFIEEMSEECLREHMAQAPEEHGYRVTVFQWHIDIKLAHKRNIQRRAARGMAPRSWEEMVANQKHWEAENNALRAQLDREKEGRNGNGRRVVWVDGGEGDALEVVMKTLTE